MRVTQSMMNSQFMSNLSANNERLVKYQDQLASGKKLNKPSDDPIAVGYAMRYDQQISRNDRYQRNVDDGLSQMEFVESNINEVNDILQRARELSVQGSTGTMSIDERNAIANEVHQLYEQMVQVGNGKFNDRYLYNGQTTDIQPYDPTNAMYQQTDMGSISFMMSEGANMQINVIGDELFGQPTTVGNETNSDNAFAALKSLETALRADNPPGIEKALGKIQDRANKIQTVWSDVGARMNRIELIQNRLKDYDANVQGLLSKTVDADVAESIMNMKVAESIQQASLSTGGKIIVPTLIDFLR
ncbi:flagellar hook-associated protein FlgL [Tumebacillus permanentifrigoris]|uniref:Flagellar hook-associated protein 3 FlgL n=1 Tax=Tumebacillus permanentifrigoris TaxID=378543 RepID=A0A316DD84_9BACL|nr:flagellar hook-associated protein FlgL [Tumebacillus permanentifrigoris]PWK16187.1 flagellar hook-associated protein 3 FlgL [Tumebacillus permanentifrigoris]